jgi:hypothetical protein
LALLLAQDSEVQGCVYCIMMIAGTKRVCSIEGVQDHHGGVSKTLPRVPTGVSGAEF